MRCSTRAPRSSRLTAESASDRRRAACRPESPERTSGSDPAEPHLALPRVHPVRRPRERREPNDAEGAKTRPANRPTRPGPHRCDQLSPAHPPVAAAHRRMNECRLRNRHPVRTGQAASPQPRMWQPRRTAPPPVRQQAKQRGQTRVPKPETKARRRAEPLAETPAMLNRQSRPIRPVSIAEHVKNLSEHPIRTPSLIVPVKRAHPSRWSRSASKLTALTSRRSVCWLSGLWTGTMRCRDSTRWGTSPVDPRQVGLNASPRG